MSASYIHRDPLVLSPTTLQLLSAKNGTMGCQNDFTNSSGRSYLDRPVSTKPSPPVHSQVSLQSPKMSPDSTLTHHLPTSTTSLSRFAPNTSPGQCASSCVSSGDGFLRSALLSATNVDNNSSGGGELHCVGSSTGNSLSAGSMSTKESGDAIRDHTPLSPNLMMRPRAMTTSSSLSRSVTPTKSTPVSSASTPSSTTPVKKSSRRNPWGSETYSDLISIAIHSYPDQQATLQQIYDFIIAHYEYFRERSDPTSSAGWKNSIRHNLSLHDRFTKCPKSSDNTKSSYWRINTEVASKPYVRRRACSMDTTNLKRSGGGHCGKASNRTSAGGHRSGAHSQICPSDKLVATVNAVSRSGAMPTLNEVQCPTLTPLLTPSDPMQARPDSRQTNTRLSTGSAFSKATYLGANKLSNYFHYPPNSGGPGKSGQELLSSPYNGMANRWSNPKPSQTAFRPTYPNSTGSYLYDQGGNNLSFESTDFSSILGSTDQALVRCRASGLIEQLLCSDHPVSAALGAATKPASTLQASQTAYLPNMFSANHLAQPMGTVNGSNRGVLGSGSTYSHDIIVSQPPAVDLRPHAALQNNLISDSSTDSRSAHHQQHHLRPLQVHNCGPGLDTTNSAFTATWNPYMPQFHLPPSSSSTGYSGFNGTGPFVSQLDSHHLSESKVKYESAETMASSNGGARLLPFLSGQHTTPLSAPTCSSTGQSAAPWRSALGLDIQTHTESHRLTSSVQQSAGESLTPLPASPCSGQSNTGHDNRPLGPPVTPPNPLYYSPMRQSLSSMYGNTDCALDTPPYQNHTVKPEPLDVLEASDTHSRSAAVSSAGPTDYDNSSRIPSTQQSGYSTSSATAVVLRSRSDTDTDSDMTSRFADAYSYDDDCEPLELELSLELADRIVGSTRPADSKP